MSKSAKAEIDALQAELDAAKKRVVVNEDLTREALERYPRYGSKIPRHDFDANT